MRALRVLRCLLLVLSLWVGAVPGVAADTIGGDFTLTDHNGESFQLEQLRGRVVLMFFGYTYCPDICPTELANLSAVLNALQDAENRVQGVFVTVDPERDTPQLLKSYVGYFNRHLIGLTGSPDQIDSVARQYRVKYKKNPHPGGAYSMDHSANLYLIDSRGKLAAVVPYGLPPEHVLGVVRQLLSEDAGN